MGKRGSSGAPDGSRGAVGPNADRMSRSLDEAPIPRDLQVREGLEQIRKPPRTHGMSLRVVSLRSTRCATVHTGDMVYRSFRGLACLVRLGDVVPPEGGEPIATPG